MNFGKRSVTILLIWVYTFQGGIKTIVWTDSLQTTFMLLAAVLSVIWLGRQLIPEEASVLTYVREHPMSQMWFFEAASDKRYFFRQFLSGALITIVMTGLDQDMMQKNLSCRSLPEAQKNMFCFSLVLIVVNLLSSFWVFFCTITPSRWALKRREMNSFLC